MLNVGQTQPFTGNVSTLIWIGPRPAADIERNLGYGPGRLRDGYWILLLKQRLMPDDFIFEGNTMRSGGKLGLPASSHSADARRPKVHDGIMDERGAEGYRNLQNSVLRDIVYSGPNRMAKVLPKIGHDSTMLPAQQYPMGGGGLQWRLVRPCNFLVAAFVDAKNIATTPTFAVDLGERHAVKLYENRSKLMRYLERA